jgi:hypothetical protein
VDVVRAIIQSFAEKQANELLRNDFLTRFEYFAMRLAKKGFLPDEPTA